MERNISGLGETLNRFIEAQRTLGEQYGMKVGTQQGDHQSGTGTKLSPIKVTSQTTS